MKEGQKGAKGSEEARGGGRAGVTALEVRAARKALGVVPSMKRVDTCAAEFEAQTPYMYSSYDGYTEAEPTNSKKVLILGGGPNRIGQGIEFDYCCCHASFSLRCPPVGPPARPVSALQGCGLSLPPPFSCCLCAHV